MYANFELKFRKLPEPSRSTQVVATFVYFHRILIAIGFVYFRDCCILEMTFSDLKSSVFACTILLKSVKDLIASTLIKLRLCCREMEVPQCPTKWRCSRTCWMADGEMVSTLFLRGLGKRGWFEVRRAFVSSIHFCDNLSLTKIKRKRSYKNCIHYWHGFLESISGIFIALLLDSTSGLLVESYK